MKRQWNQRFKRFSVDSSDCYRINNQNFCLLKLMKNKSTNHREKKVGGVDGLRFIFGLVTSTTNSTSILWKEAKRIVEDTKYIQFQVHISKPHTHTHH